MTKNTNGQDNNPTDTQKSKRSTSKKLLLEQLAKTPIMSAACQKSGLPKATVYRWLKKDKKFASAVEKAIAEGVGLINDISESQLVSMIKNGNFNALAFWLKHNSVKYKNKLEIDANLRQMDEALSPQEQQFVDKALMLLGLLDKQDGGPANERNNKDVQ